MLARRCTTDPHSNRLEVDVEPGLAQHVGGHLRLRPDGRNCRRGQHHDLLAIVAGGGEVPLQLGVVLRPAHLLDAHRTGHRGAGHKNAGIDLVQLGCSAADSLHNLLLVDRGERDPADGDVVEGWIQVVKPQAGDLARAVLHRHRHVLVRLDLRHQIEARIFPPVDLAPLQGGRDSGGIRDERPYNAVDVHHLRPGIEAWRAVLAGHIGRVLGKHDRRARHTLIGHKLERAAADCLGDLLHRVGLRQTLRHDGTVHLRQGSG